MFCDSAVVLAGWLRDVLIGRSFDSRSGRSVGLTGEPMSIYSFQDHRPDKRVLVATLTVALQQQQQRQYHKTRSILNQNLLAAMGETETKGSKA